MNNIIKFSFLFVLALTVFSCKEKASDATAAAGDAATDSLGTSYTIDVATTKVGWEGTKPAGKHMGTINVTEGTVAVSNGKLSAGNLTLDMNSITVTDLTGDEKTSLESHLKGTAKEGVADFFNVTKYPTAKFELVSVEDLANDTNGNNATVSGNLTLLDSTKMVTFPAVVTVAADKVTIDAKAFDVNRTAFGIKYGSKTFFDNLKDKFIEDIIKIQFSLVATAAPASAPAQ